MQADPSSRAASTTWRYRVAHLLAYTISPLSLPPVLFGLVLAHFGAPAPELIRIIGLSAVFFGLIPLAYIYRQVRQDEIATLEIRQRSQRTRPLLVGTGAAVIGTGILFFVGETAQALVVAIGLCFAANTVVLLLINLWWKISLHAAGVAGFVAFLVFVVQTPWQQAIGWLQPTWVAATALLIPVILWARVATAAHTPKQVLAGAAFGGLVPFAEMALLYALGFFAEL